MKQDRQPGEKEKYEVELQEASDRVSERLDKWYGKYDELLDGRRRKMSGFNRVVMMGNLTRDPEARQLPSGTAVTEMGLAVTETYKNKDGEFNERVCYVNVVTWGKQAEACAEHLKKGSPVLVEGRLQFDQWETKDGQKRSKHRVRADRVKFLRRAASTQQQDRAPAMASSTTVDDDMPF